jgi:hypothetical protein
MTGINPYGSNILDYPEARYQKLKTTAEKYRIIQVGLCLWNKLEIDGKSVFKAKPYNFYVFPEENSGNQFLNCETGSIIFNREHKLDFNKWIYKGIPYINSKFEKQQFESIMDSNLNFYDPSDKSKLKNIIVNKEEDKKNYDEFCRKFSDFIYSDEESQLFEKLPKFLLYHFLNNMQESLRKRIFITFDNNLEGKGMVRITKVDPTARQKLLETEYNDKIAEFSRRKGFKKVWDAMIKRKSIFIGHNCAYDILFMISHFGDPLPNSLKDYKTMLKNYFKEYYILLKIL